jgi:cell division protease FtsH
MEKKNPLKKKPGNKVTKDKKVAKKVPTTRAGRIIRGPLFWIVVAILGVTIFGQISSVGNRYTEIGTSQALDAIAQSKVESALVIDRSQKLQLILKPGELIEGSSKVESSYVARQEPTIIDSLTGNPPPKGWNVSVPKQSLFVSFLFSIFPILLIGFLFFFLMSNAQGGNKVFSFGKSRAKLQDNDVPQNTFADVAGADEAIAELEEIKDFLANPAKYALLGAKIPKGVLLYGPPGTGKTLLARAVAGEAKVPFYSISGSDFVEMFVGVGAARVRGAGMGGGHDEREQTLNQLLVEMDGFETGGQVILIAATNRPDVLDPALLRPGRFDRQIAVDRPDLKGREEILKVHAKTKPLSDEVELLNYARRTPGFTGADLANVLNEAALLAAREEKKVISNLQIDEAIDRVMAGPQRKSRIMSDDQRRVTAYHEAGHALVAHALPHTDPVHKITIMPRGRALGYTMVLPDDDKYSTTRNQLLDQLAYSLGGRAAEELIFHDPSTGASNDIEKATALARAMATQYGMTEAIGAIKLGSDASEPFMGRDYGHQRDYSESIAATIDAEIRNLIETAHQEAFDILVENRATLDAMVLELLEKETLNKEAIAEIFAKVNSWPRRPSWTGSSTRIPSQQPPVAVPERLIVKPASEKKPSRVKKSTNKESS